MNKIAAVGVEASVLIFKFLDIDVFPVKDAAGTVEVLREILGKYTVIFMEELFLDEAKNLISETDLSINTTVIPLPLQGNQTGKAIKRTKNFIRKAIGISKL